MNDTNALCLRAAIYRERPSQSRVRDVRDAQSFAYLLFRRVADNDFRFEFKYTFYLLQHHYHYPALHRYDGLRIFEYY